MTLEVIKISMESGLDIVSLPSHTSHALQPLDIVCFKPFKTVFRQIKDAWCLTNKNQAIGKQTMCEWTSKALQHVLTPSNIQVGFKGIGIWPLDRKASKSFMLPSRGFDEGLVGQGRRGLTGTGSGGDCKVTCPIDHLEASNDTVTGQASHSNSNQSMHIKRMHVLHCTQSGSNSDTPHVFVEDDGREVGEIVHNRVHYYIHVSNSKESSYQACDRNV